jgi:carboxypeptidase Taq
MPEGGGAVRAHHHATVSSVMHGVLVSDRLGELLEELRPFEESLDYDSNEACLIRHLCRVREKEMRVPAQLRQALAFGASESYPVWVEARRTSNFDLLRPYLERGVELRRRYAGCFDVADPYDALLDDFEPGLKTAEVEAVFDRLKGELPQLVTEASAAQVDDSLLDGSFAVEPQQQLQAALLGRFGFREGTWRIDVALHPFAASLATSDIRLTTHYPPNRFSVFAAMHEAGHAIYEHNIDPALERTPLCVGASAGIHESQSRLFENIVGRSLAWWRWAYPQVQRLFTEQFGAVPLEDFHRAINKVQPSLIRITADETTYSLHIILRFELERELLAGTLAVADLPAAWNERMRDYLGVEVPDDADGVLQDPHWCGEFGTFPAYALGNVISVQLWDRAFADLPDLEARLEEGDLAPLTGWLRDHLWRLGRKFTAGETLERAVGSGLDPEPYLRYLRGKVAALSP